VTQLPEILEAEPEKKKSPWLDVRVPRDMATHLETLGDSWGYSWGWDNSSKIMEYVTE
jgi:hypothetical protein